MVFGNAQIHLCIADHGESLLGTYLMAIVTHANILKRELLLVHGSRSKQSCFHPLLQPLSVFLKPVVMEGCHDVTYLCHNQYVIGLYKYGWMTPVCPLATKI